MHVLSIYIDKLYSAVFKFDLFYQQGKLIIQLFSLLLYDRIVYTVRSKLKIKTSQNTVFCTIII